MNNFWLTNPTINALALGQRLVPFHHDSFSVRFANLLTDRMALSFSRHYLYLVQGKSNLWLMGRFIEEKLYANQAINLDGGLADAQAADATNFALTDGRGWIPVMFDNLTGGSPISNLPIDPINTIGSLTAPASTDLVYRYACSSTPLAFEIDAQLESTAYRTTDDKRAKDGGNSTSYYEVGTNLKIMGLTPSGVDF